MAPYEYVNGPSRPFSRQSRIQSSSLAIGAWMNGLPIIKTALLRFWVLVAIAVAPCLAVAAESAAVSTPRVTATLLSSRDAVMPGERFQVALVQKIAPGWHTYWANPGRLRASRRGSNGRCRMARPPATSSGRRRMRSLSTRWSISASKARSTCCRRYHRAARRQARRAARAEGQRDLAGLREDLHSRGRRLHARPSGRARRLSSTRRRSAASQLRAPRCRQPAGFKAHARGRW